LTILSLLLSWAATFLFASLAARLAFASGSIDIPVRRVLGAAGRETAISGSALML
jgi:hypothetical protein